MLTEWFPIDWNEFHFLRPDFLWAFIPIFFILVFGLFTLNQEVKWKKMIAPHLRTFVIQKGNHNAKLWMNFVLLIVMSLGVFSLAGPTWKQIEVEGQTLETPLVLLLDLSQSMMADDLQPNRLERAKFKVNDLLNQNPQAQTALVGFAGTAHTIVPLTSDYKIINSHIEGLKPYVMPFSGSDLEVGLALSDSVMTKTDAPGTIVIFSDDFTSDSFDILKNYITNSENKLEIIPMNTMGGSEIPSRWGKSSMKDENSQVVYSAIDQAILNQLQSLDGITVHSLTLDNSDVEVISKKIAENLEFKSEPEEKENQWEDAGIFLAFPMAVLVLLWFRKGWVIYFISMLMFSSCADIHDFNDLWYAPDFQGQMLSEKGDFADAAEKFEDPMRKGIAFFKSGDFEKAISSFGQDTSAMGAYNLGLAYLNNGDTLAAQFAFTQAVEMDPSNEAAGRNKELLEQIIGRDSEVDPKDAEEVDASEQAENEQNKDMEDLGGGGQEATKKDMEKERKEETVSTDTRKGKELDEVPDDFETEVPKQDNSKVLLRKVDDDPVLFLKRKFEYQIKQNNIKPKTNAKDW